MVELLSPLGLKGTVSRKQEESLKQRRPVWSKDKAGQKLPDGKGAKGIYILTSLSPLGPPNCCQGPHLAVGAEDKEAPDAVPSTQPLEAEGKVAKGGVWNLEQTKFGMFGTNPNLWKFKS